MLCQNFELLHLICQKAVNDEGESKAIEKIYENENHTLNDMIHVQRPMIKTVQTKGSAIFSKILTKCDIAIFKKRKSFNK